MHTPTMDHNDVPSSVSTLAAEDSALRPSGPRLLADIGGTNARFAWQGKAGAPIEHIHTLACSQFDSLQQAITHYLGHTGLPRPQQAAIAIANPVTGDHVQMTNHHWSFSQSALQSHFGWQHQRVLNDFTALALALPHLAPSDLRRLCSTSKTSETPNAATAHSATPQPHEAVPRGPAARRPLALIGAGTGLGVSGLLPVEHGHWIALEGEGGHVTLAARTAFEHELLEWMSHRYEHVSAERVLSGPGLEFLYEAIAAVLGQPVRQPVAAAEIVRQALREPTGLAAQAVHQFCAWLGCVAGNLALTLGAFGGVYIGGGIAPRLGELLDQSPFMQRFTNKGRMRVLLEHIPVWVIVSPTSPALLGAAQALDSAA